MGRASDAGRGKCAAAWILTVAVAFACAAPLARAQAAAPRAPAAAPVKRRVAPYQLESVELKGTTRMTSEQVVTELGLTAGTPLTDDLVMNTRTRLLGLGLFKSVILVMRKGTKPGLAKLVVEVDDDDEVLTDWALGGELGVTLTERAAASSPDQSTPMDYRLSLIARNLFGDLHRGVAAVDLDSDGNLREGELAYGLPRFAKEDAQFDAQIAVVDAYYRYLDALGFGSRAQGLWSRTLEGQGELLYGAAMYLNQDPRYRVPGYPKAVFGPKVAFYRETRLNSFFPGSGHLTSASLLFSPVETQHSVLELELARTASLGRYLFLTADAKVLSIGVSDVAVRGEGRADVPIGGAGTSGDQAAAFMLLRGGQDSVGKASFTGSAAILGLRYHSAGFIAEIAVKVTRAPDALAPKAARGDERPDFVHAPYESLGDAP